MNRALCADRSAGPTSRWSAGDKLGSVFPPSPSPVPPGWYADGSGTVRWWDGIRWGRAAVTPPTRGVVSLPHLVSPPSVDSQRRTAASAQWLGLLGVVSGILGVVGPAAALFSASADQRFVRHHAVESVNFQITMLIGWMMGLVCIVSGLMLIVPLVLGVVILPVVLVQSVVFPILAAQAASRGEWYRYPINLRLVPGAVG